MIFKFVSPKAFKAAAPSTFGLFTVLCIGVGLIACVLIGASTPTSQMNARAGLGPSITKKRKRTVRAGSPAFRVSKRIRKPYLSKKAKGKQRARESDDESSSSGTFEEPVQRPARQPISRIKNNKQPASRLIKTENDANDIDVAISSSNKEANEEDDNDEDEINDAKVYSTETHLSHGHSLI